MSNQVQCNRCGYIFDSEDEEFGYCPLCENDQVEINKPYDFNCLRVRANTPNETLEMPLEEQIDILKRGGYITAITDIPKFLKIQEDEFNVIYINLRDIVKIQECLEEDKYILYSSRGEYYEVPSNKKTSAIVEYLLNQLL